MKKGDFVKVVKLSDDKYDGFHPNGIFRGYTVYGEIENPPIEGEALLIVKAKGDAHGSFHTSVITEIVDENTFKTLNSTYHIEMIDFKKEISEEKNN